MQQRSLNSHFKVKKNTLADGAFSSNEKSDLGISEKKRNEIPEDKMKLVVQSSGKPSRAKRVPRDSDESFEEPEVVGKRVKLEKKKPKKQDKKIEKEQNNDILQSFKKSNGKAKGNSKNEEDHEIIEKKALFDKISKKSPKKEDDVIMSDATERLKRDKLILSESKSSAKIDSNSPKPMDLSNKTKSIIESILKKKSEAESGKKTTETFNYLNYSSAVLKTPAKTNNNSINHNLFGLSSNNNSYQNINNNFSINNTPVKNANTLSATPSKPAELKLSQKTLDVINQLKSERKNRFERDSLPQERVRSESSFSLKFKYEDLIKEERELILPPHYKKLLQSFSDLDLILNFNKLGSRRNSVPVFEDIQQSIENSYKHKFDFKTYLQILYVTPHLYIYKWQKMNLNSEDYSLIIDIPKDHQKRLRGETNYDEHTNCKKLQTEIYDPALQPLTNAELEERKKIFKNALIAITNEYHMKYLESIDFTRDYDAYKLKTWHHEFDLEKVAPIPIFEILEKPTIKITSIEEFLQNNDIKNSLIQRAIEGINNSNEEDKLAVGNSLENEDTMSITTNKSADPHLNSLSKYLQPSLLKKIVAKEEAVNISNEFMQYSSQKAKEKNKVKEYQSFVDKLKTIFITNSSPSICITELIGKLNNSSRWSFSEGNFIFILFYLDQMKIIIQRLSTIFPHWLKIIDHSNLGTLVRMEKSVAMVEIMSRISDAHTIELIEN